LKFFITWHPVPPDPPYWKWFEPDGIAVSLANVNRRFVERATTLGIHRVLGYDGTILVDSLTPSSFMSQIHVLALQSWMKPDLAAHKDYPIFDKSLSPSVRWKMLKKTIANAEVALKFEDKLGIRLIYVIQGWDLRTFTWCAVKYLEMGISRMGLGSSKLISPKNLIRRVKAVRQIIGKRNYLHVFGALKPSVLKCLLKYVDSVDSSSPVQAAIRKSVYIITKENKLKRIKLDYTSLDDLIKLLPKELNAWLVKAFEDEYIENMLKKSKDARAILNAYILTRYVRLFSK